MLEIHTEAKEADMFDKHVNEWQAVARKQGFKIQGMDFKVVLTRDKEDAPQVHCVVFIRYDDGKTLKQLYQ